MRFVTRFVRAAAAAALFLLAFSPVQAAENNPFENYKSPNGNTFVLTLFQNPRTLDIQKTNADYFIPLQIYSRLVEAEPDGKGGAVIVPGLTSPRTAGPTPSTCAKGSSSITARSSGRTTSCSPSTR